MPGPITREALDDIFSYHPPYSDDQKAAYTAIRDAGKVFAQTIIAFTPSCADQTAAIRKVREAVFTSNAAIALRGRV